MITFFTFQILNSVRANATTKDGMIADKDRQLSEQDSTITDLISQRDAALVERDALLQVFAHTLVLYMRNVEIILILIFTSVRRFPPTFPLYRHIGNILSTKMLSRLGETPSFNNGDR